MTNEAETSKPEAATKTETTKAADTADTTKAADTVDATKAKPADANSTQVSADLPGAGVQSEVKAEGIFDVNKLGILNDMYVTLNIEIGRSHIKIRDLLNLNKGSIIELDKLAGEPVDIYANGKLISKGNIVTINGKYCVRLISINENANQEVK